MKRIARRDSRTFSHALIAGALLGVMALGGCVSYTNVPEPESAPAFRSANHLQAMQVTAAALEEVIDRYPMRDAQGRYSVNLPAGTTLESAIEITKDLPEGLVLPYEGMDDTIPVYHIGRIWIRVSDAKVDVLYPARSFDGTPYEGDVTVWLNGGIRRWKVNRLQHWAPGTIETPPIYVPVPEEEFERGSATPDDADAQMSDDLSDEPVDEVVVQEETIEAEPVSEPQPTPEPQAQAKPEPTPAGQGDPDAPWRQVPVDD